MITKHPRCKHNRRRELCRDCGGSQICRHDKVKTQCRKYGTALCPHRKWKGECALCRPKAGYNRYKKSAGTRGIAFLLTFEQFISIINQSCRYCGEQPAGGADRLNNARGYTRRNAVSCCSTCNRMKLLLTEEQFLIQVRRIHAYRHGS
jgi:hypothetical protein